VSYKSSPLRVS